MLPTSSLSLRPSLLAIPGRPSIKATIDLPFYVNPRPHLLVSFHDTISFIWNQLPSSIWTTELPPSCLASCFWELQTVDLDFPNTTESYRLYCQRFIASDIKECECGAPDTPYDGIGGPGLGAGELDNSASYCVKAMKTTQKGKNLNKLKQMLSVCDVAMEMEDQGFDIPSLWADVFSGRGQEH
ncbi:unnamed protein product [Lactuca saligna]|uniref:Uncharacterized protein n=1 Tax=Lactuca saligna TaxID=75948 RepID=A0AA35V105_LACSI|nr:unnamed protein product [Lactuca saligna]